MQERHVAGPVVGPTTFTTPDGQWSANLDLDGHVTVFNGCLMAAEVELGNDPYAAGHVWQLIKIIRSAQEGEAR